MTKTCCILLAPGAEESEVVITCDVLRRGGIDVSICGLQDDPLVECAQKTKLGYDKKFKDCVNCTYDLVVIPGGPGHKKICACPQAGEFLRRHEKEGKFIGAICAGPIVLQTHGVGTGGNFTIYPSEKEKIVKDEKYNYTGERVTLWNNIITSQAPGTAFEFALKLVEILQGRDQAQKVCESLLCTCHLSSPLSQAPRIR
ncbi:DJ-1/PfpI family domain-containing protein [Ditylenchus destructor]|uniref:DJ-1/PfpI family domain-containing protein n=1 Tax=Ditylenchus destructor TaxID=166010 RepID=A0AAD4NBH7_9BILA|nr:DJ-1/PfpI family domain-containing protein [Ditylenchus destructor]